MLLLSMIMMMMMIYSCLVSKVRFNQSSVILQIDMKYKIWHGLHRYNLFLLWQDIGISRITVSKEWLPNLSFSLFMISSAIAAISILVKFPNITKWLFLRNFNFSWCSYYHLLALVMVLLIRLAMRLVLIFSEI